MQRKNDLPGSASFGFILENNLKAYRSFLMENCRSQVSYPKGTIITCSGTVSGRIFFLLDGIVKISVTNIQGYERVLGLHKQNTIFAMDGLPSEENVVVTTTALTPVSAIKLTFHELRDLFRQNPAFAADVVLYYGEVLKLMCYDAESQTSNHIKARLANFIILYMQSEDYRHLGYLPFSHSELASAVGASRVHTARICAEFAREGLIRTEKKKMYILNLQKIRELASYHGFE